MPHMKTFPRPTESNDQENKSGYRGRLLLTLAVYSKRRWLSVVRGAVERLTETLGFPALQCRSITRAVDEALTNILRHSYGNRLGQPIALYFRSAKRRQHGEIESGLEILLCDRGRAIALNALRGRPLEQIRPGGLGLHLIRQAMDTVEFTRKGLTNQLLLVKYFAQISNAP
jgi:serine/threonine-protein kinase RsbW